jgi:prepilin-type processing-associated H-X9-DG protein
VLEPAEMMALGDSLHGGLDFSRGELSYYGRVGNGLSRHGGRAGVFFCDGHVDSPTLNFLFRDLSDAALTRWNRDHLPHREGL